MPLQGSSLRTLVLTNNRNSQLRYQFFRPPTSDEIERKHTLRVAPCRGIAKPQSHPHLKKATLTASLAHFTSQSLGDASAAASQIDTFKPAGNACQRLLRIHLRGSCRIAWWLYQVLASLPAFPWLGFVDEGFPARMKASDKKCSDEESK